MNRTDPPTNQSESSILAIHPGALGDVILFGHLLSVMDGDVTLVAGGEKGELLAGLGVVNRVLDFAGLPMHEVFTEDPPEQCKLPKLLAEHGRLISCFPAGDRKAELRLVAMCEAANAAFLPVRPPEDFTGHLLDLWSDVLDVQQVSTAPSPWRVPSSWCEAARQALGDIGASVDDPYVLIHPGAGSAEKCWGLERFLKLSSHLDGVVFILGPVECERWDDDEIESLRRRFPVLISPPLSVLTGALSGAKGFIGNDSGVAHLAAATGTPTVVLFGPTHPEHFAPRGRWVEIISAESINQIEPDRCIKVLGKLVARPSRLC